MSEIEINGMAHVILTVSQFDVARDFYCKLLPYFGMKLIHNGSYQFGGSLVDIAQLGASATVDPEAIKNMKKN